MTTRFTWNESKALTNQRKHNVGFEIAIRVFRDPFAITEQDRIEDGEYRWRTIGSTDGISVLLVARMVEEDDGVEVIHIISARRAERHERRRYEQERSRRL